MTGLIVGIGSNPADVVRATASPYAGWAGFNYDFFLPRPKAKEVLLLLAANDIRAVTLAGTSPGHRVSRSNAQFPTKLLFLDERALALAQRLGHFFGRNAATRKLLTRPGRRLLR